MRNPEVTENEQVLLPDGVDLTECSLDGDMVTHPSNVALAEDGEVDLTVTYLPPVTEAFRTSNRTEQHHLPEQILQQRLALIHEQVRNVAS